MLVQFGAGGSNHPGLSFIQKILLQEICEQLLLALDHLIDLLHIQFHVLHIVGSLNTTIRIHCLGGSTGTDGYDALPALNRAIEENVAFVPGVHFYPEGGHANTLRLNFSMQECDNIRIGMERLGRAIANK